VLVANDDDDSSDDGDDDDHADDKNNGQHAVFSSQPHAYPIYPLN